MAVTKVTTINSGGGGVSFDQQNGLSESWTVTFRVCGDCRQDPRSMILEAIDLGLLPDIGDQWDFSTGPVDDLFATSISPGSYSEQGCLCCLEVTVSYSIVENPIEMCPTIETYYQEEERVIESAEFFGAWEDDGSNNNCKRCEEPFQPEFSELDNCAVKRELDSCGPIVNAAGQYLEPLPTKIHRLKGYRFTFNYPDFDGDLSSCHEGAINCDSFEFEIPCCNFTKSFAAKTAMLVAVTASPETRQLGATEEKYWAVTFDILEDPDGWCVDYLNRGLHVTNCPDDTDFHGGSVGGVCIVNGQVDESVDSEALCDDSFGDWQPAPGVPTTRPVFNQDGFTATEPVNLGLDGQALGPDDDPVYLQYCAYPCTDYANEVLP